jgi:preprotein translocase subunit SecE
MARLQKKKTPTVKTKKKEVPAAAGTSREAGKGSGTPAKPGVSRSTVKSAPATATGEPNMIQQAMTFLREVRVELKKVTWPTRKQTAGSTMVVIILVFILAAFLGLVDISLSKLVQVVLA